ncbi:hypothetical protein ACXZ9C_10560 [Streptococcus agalactiae]
MVVSRLSCRRVVGDCVVVVRRSSSERGESLVVVGGRLVTSVRSRMVGRWWRRRSVVV